VVAFPERSPLLALWERVGQAAERRDLTELRALGEAIERLCRARKAAS